MLSGGGVDYIIVGGVAAGIHGALRTTLDLDIVYSRDPANVDRLVAALEPFQPYLRGAPAGLPFRLDAQTVLRGLNFTLTTSLGDLDLIGEITGGGGYEALKSSTDLVELEGYTCRVVSLRKLIDLKRAAGRAKDREALAELEALIEERDRPDE